MRYEFRDDYNSLVATVEVAFCVLIFESYGPLSDGHSPVLPLGVLQLAVVLLQVLGERGEVLAQEVLEGLLFLGADYLAGREAQAELLGGQFDLAGQQAGDVVPAVLAEADHHRHVGVRLPVGPDDALQLLVDQRQPLFVGEEANDGELGDEAQVGAQLAHVGRLVLLPGLKVLLPRLQQQRGELCVPLVEEGAQVDGAAHVGDLQLGLHDGAHGLADVLAEVQRAEVVGERVPLLLGERAQLLHEGRVLFEAGVQAAEEGLLGPTLLGVLVLAAELLPALIALPGLLVQLMSLLLFPAEETYK